MDMKTLQIPLPEDIMKLKWNGQFDLCKEIIDLRIQKDIPEELKERLLLEKELLDILPNEFIYTKEEALQILKDEIKDFKDEEFDALFKEGIFEFLYIDGVMKFKEDFAHTLMKQKEEYARRGHDIIDKKELALRDYIVSTLQDKGEVSYKLHIKVGAKVKKQRIGKTLRVWLPIPVERGYVEDFKILKVTPDHDYIVNDDTANARSVYFEIPYEKDMDFEVEYEFVNHVVKKDLNPSKVINKTYDFELDEIPPHYVFTPYLRNLTKEIVGEETNPLLKAKKIYLYICTHIPYSYVRSYITLPPIPEYIATTLKGDCGIFSSLFITMCRIAGVPAKWQAGLYAVPSPVEIDNHDWAMCYVEPYGWIYVDCSFGVDAHRNHSASRLEHYFGHLDPFRIPSVEGWQEPLTPEKKYTRRDPYDHQNGEMEYEDCFLSVEDYEFTKAIVEIKEL